MTKNSFLLVLCATIASFPLGCGGNSVFSEESRVTSPNGTLDAVMILQNGAGALDGLTWHAFIVAKGSAVNIRNSHEIFRASTLVGERLIWSQPHLLEIHYQLAHIEQFRNLWGLHEMQNVGSQGERDYLVEIRLMPSTNGFSLLTPNGNFKTEDKQEKEK